MAVLLAVVSAGCSQLPQLLATAPSSQAPALLPTPQPGAPREASRPHYFWWERPITILVGAPRGARADLGARLLAPWLEQLLGQPVVPVNRPGGDGAEAWTQLKQARPDAYTLGILASPQFQLLALDPQQKAGFGPGDFAPVAGQARESSVLFVRSSSPFKRVEELVEAARGQPGSISLSLIQGSASDHLAATELQRRANVQLRLVSYLNATDARMAVLSGQVDAELGPLAGVIPSLRTGQGRLLAVTEESRLPEYADIPTLKERGLGVVAYSALGYVLPRGTAGDLVDYLAWVFYRAISERGHQDQMQDAGLPVRYLAPDQYARFLSGEAERVKQLQPGTGR